MPNTILKNPDFETEAMTITTNPSNMKRFRNDRHLIILFLLEIRKITIANGMSEAQYPASMLGSAKVDDTRMAPPIMALLYVQFFSSGYRSRSRSEGNGRTVP
jgi:hypothetical protein